MMSDLLIISPDQTTTSGYVTPLLESRGLDFPGLRQTAVHQAAGVVSSSERHALSSGEVISSRYIVVDQTDDGGAHLVAPSLYAFVGHVRAVDVQPIERPSLAVEPANSCEERRIAIAEQPSPSVAALRWIEEATGLPKTRIHPLFGISRTAIYDWRRGERITDAHRQRLLAVHDVLRRAQRRHNTPALLAAWLDTPTGVGGVTPARLLEAGKIDRARMLAMATPSPGLAPVPHWVRRRPPEAWDAGAESRQEPFPPNGAEASPPGNRGE